MRIRLLSYDLLNLVTSSIARSRAALDADRKTYLKESRVGAVVALFVSAAVRIYFSSAHAESGLVVAL